MMEILFVKIKQNNGTYNRSFCHTDMLQTFTLLIVV